MPGEAREIEGWNPRANPRGRPTLAMNTEGSSEMKLPIPGNTPPSPRPGAERGRRRSRFLPSIRQSAISKRAAEMSGNGLPPATNLV
jgi:hypothetical protein